MRPSIRLTIGTTACKWDVIIPLNDYIEINNKKLTQNEFYLHCFNKGISFKESKIIWGKDSKKGLWYHYDRIIKDNGAIVLFGNQPFTSKLIMSNPKIFKYCWIWNKKRITCPMLAKKQPLRQHEDICVFYKKQCSYNPQLTLKSTSKSFSKKEMKDGKGEVWGGMKRSGVRNENEYGYPKSILNDIPVITNMSKEKFIHPTQKPIKLLEYLIYTYTNENEIVLDNCAGSFSTAISCINTNRKFIGYEKEEKYFEIGKERILKHLDSLNK